MFNINSKHCVNNNIVNAHDISDHNNKPSHCHVDNNHNVSTNKNNDKSILITNKKSPHLSQHNKHPINKPLDFISK